jgi:hypothetical protein
VPSLHACRSTLEDPHQAELLRKQAQAVSRLTDIPLALTPDQPLEQQLRAIGEGIREATPFQAILFSVYEAETGLLRRVLGMGGTELEFVIMVIAVSCVKLLSAHNSTQHTSRKHKV